MKLSPDLKNIEDGKIISQKKQDAITRIKIYD